MTDITNADRSAWAAEAIDAFTSVCRMDGEDNQTKAKDLATNLVHYLRLECGLSFEEASTVIHNAVNMAEQETEEDGDGDEPSLTTYGVRFWATFRACAEVEIEARDDDHLKELIRAYDWRDLDFHRRDEDFTKEGDETASVFGPDEDDPSSSPWDNDLFEIDLRDPGDPFAWEAEAIVKELAELAEIVNETHRRKKFDELLARAKAACTKEG